MIAAKAGTAANRPELMAVTLPMPLSTVVTILLVAHEVNPMLCPLCHERGGEKVSGETPLESWRCPHCQGVFPVYHGYPAHPAAFAALADNIVGCPICGEKDAELVPDAPAMGIARVFRCRDCSALFPALLVDPAEIGPDGLILDANTDYYLPVHPQAMIDTVAGVDRLPSFFALTQRLREYIEHTGFTIARTEDRLDMDTQVREFSFFFVPDNWATDHTDRAAAVQAAIGFAWHAGLAQYAGVPTSALEAPVPVGLQLSVMINPDMLANSLQAYLNVVAGLSEVLHSMGLEEATVIEAEVIVAPHTQEATIRRLAAVRRFSLDLSSPDQWTALIMAMPQQQILLNKVWELVSNTNA